MTLNNLIINYFGGGSDACNPLTVTINWGAVPDMTTAGAATFNFISCGGSGTNTGVFVECDPGGSGMPTLRFVPGTCVGESTPLVTATAFSCSPFSITFPAFDVTTASGCRVRSSGVTVF
jgi:hypothetical protein